MLDLVVRDGPSRDDPRLLRKADLFKDELGLDVRVTVARPVADAAPRPAPPRERWRARSIPARTAR